MAVPRQHWTTTPHLKGPRKALYRKLDCRQRRTGAFCILERGDMQTMTFKSAAKVLRVQPRVIQNLRVHAEPLVNLPVSWLALCVVALLNDQAQEQ